MSKANQAVATTEAKVEKTEAPVVKHKFELPKDGTKGPEFIKEQGGVSKAIRALTNDGYTRGEVAKMLNKRYQHVRNVLITPIKKEG